MNTQSRKYSRLIVMLLVGLLAGFQTAGVASAAAITVTTTGDDNTPNGNCSLREAIIAANTNAVVDTCAAGSPTATDIITLVGGQTYTLTLPGAGENASATGDLDIVNNTASTDLVINTTGGMATIHAGTGDRVMQTQDGTTVELDDITISGGSAPDNGGGIANISSTGALTLNHVVVSGNSAHTSGGGIFSNGTLLIENGSVIGGPGTGNSAANGGGIYLDGGDLTLDGSTVSDNSATNGGGIFVNLTGSALIRNSSIVDSNHATYGGGILNFKSLNVQSGSTIGGIGAGNTATSAGGGVYNVGLAAIDSATISGNSASADGGGIYNSPLGHAVVTASRLLGNTVVSGSGSALLSSATIANNTSVTGSCIVGNGVAAVKNSQSVSQAATGNWWGDPGGPNPPGPGDTISGTWDTSGVRSTPPVAGCSDGLIVQVAGAGSGVISDTLPGGAIACVSTSGVKTGDCDEWRVAGSGTVFAIVAAPDSGFSFGGWSGCDSLSMATLPGDTCHVTLNADATITASFLPRYTLTVVGSGTGAGTVSGGTLSGCAIAGGSTTGTCTDTEDEGTVITLSAAAGTGSTFAGWSGGGCSGAGSCEVTLTADTTVTASFSTNSYTLAVAGSGNGGGAMTDAGNGIGCAWDGTSASGTCDHTALYGAEYSITAAADTGSAFTGWTGCDSTSGGQGEVCHIKPAADVTVTAGFALNSYTLTVAGSGNGGGAITDAGNGIDCAWDGTSASGTCNHTALYGAEYSITAAADTGSAFTGWTGCDSTSGGQGEVCHVKPAADVTVTAGFAVSSYTLTVAGSGNGGGAITDAGNGIGCAWDGTSASGTCNHTALYGAEYSITAAADTGSAFTGWTGCDSTSGGQGEVCHIKPAADVTVTAGFALNSYTLTVAGSGNGGGAMTDAGNGIDCAWDGTSASGTCNHTALYGAEYSITAAAAPHSDFTGWTGCDSTSGGQGEVCHVKPAADVTVTAGFAVSSYTLTVAGSGNGGGAMTNVGNGIDCAWDGSSASGTCDHTALYGASYDVVASPAAGSAFTGWTGCDSTGTTTIPGDTCHVAPVADATVTASFSLLGCSLANCSFESPAGPNLLVDSWKQKKLNLSSEGTDTTFFVDGAQSFRFANPKAKAKMLWQDVSVSGPAGANLTASFWWRGEDVSGRKGLFRVIVYLYYAKGGKSKFFANLPVGTHDWAQYNLTFSAKRAYKKVRVEIDFGKAGTAWFDALGLAIN